MPTRRATIHDVAKAARVSTTTVSDALAGRGRIAEDTRQRVQAAAESIGYVASAAARNLRLGRSGAIGLYVPDRTVGFEYYVHLSRGAAEAALGRGFALTLVPAWPDAEQLRALHLDGIIVADPALDDPVLETLRAMPVPMVTCERDLSPGADAVGVVQSDHTAAMGDLVGHLMAAGARRITVLTPGQETAFGQDLQQAYRRPGVEFTLLDIPLAFTDEDVVHALSGVAENPPDAVIAVPDGAAVTALHVLHEQGLAVPDDVLLASYVDGPMLLACHPQITGVDINPRLAGTLAIRVLVHAIEREQLDPSSSTVPAALRVRGSTQRPRR